MNRRLVTFGSGLSHSLDNPRNFPESRAESRVHQIGRTVKNVAEAWHIGKAAQETGLSIDAIRFYERVGLLKKPSRTEGGFRLYDQKSVSDLKFIQKAQERGFTLAEIRRLLVLRNFNRKACPQIKSLLQEKLATVRLKRRELEAMGKGMRRDLVECQRALRRRHTGHAQPCPLLAELEEQGERNRTPSCQRNLKHPHRNSSPFA